LNRIGERAHGEVRHLAILVVYFLKDDDDLPFLEVHFDRIARHTLVPYTIYAAINRATPAARALIDGQPNLVVCEVSECDLRGSREHAWYLDALVRRALDDDGSHLCTLDVDSFPVRDDWVARVSGAAPAESGLAGVLRIENGDVALPHPSCVFATRAFYERFTPSFSPDTDGSAEFRQFLRITGQSADTGIRLGYVLWCHDLPWGHLLRSNRTDPDGIMAGIYADSVFHMGGIGRGKLFRRDLDASAVHRLTTPLERIPVRGETAVRVKRAVLRRLRGSAEARLAARNRDTYALLRGWLFSDPDGLVAFLRGGAPAS
jgi:hypothetical protein